MCEGTFKYPDGSIYEGNLIYDKKNGTGKLTNADGSIFHDGNWDEDRPLLHKTI